MMFYPSPCRDSNSCALGSRNSAFWQEVSKAREEQGKGLVVQWGGLSEGLETHIDVLRSLPSVGALL